MINFTTKLEAPLWRTSTVCTVFGVSRKTVSDWAERGWIPQPTFIGHTAYWEKSALLNQLRNQANIALPEELGL